MAHGIGRGYCPACEKMVRAEIHEFNHTPHILASVFLCGCWSPVWLLFYLFRDRLYFCSQCGTHVLERGPKRKLRDYDDDDDD